MSMCMLVYLVYVSVCGGGVCVQRAVAMCGACMCLRCVLCLLAHACAV